MQFVLISLVILPVLPNQTYDPYDVINPFKNWVMVVLIVGIGLFGYVVFKLFSAKAGTLLGGVLGGMTSSTATAISVTLIFMIAKAISIVRVLLEVLRWQIRSSSQSSPRSRCCSAYSWSLPSSYIGRSLGSCLESFEPNYSTMPPRQQTHRSQINSLPAIIGVNAYIKPA